MSLTIWHNPRCSKSRQTLARLEAAGHTPQVRTYLTDPPSLPELREALARLGGPAKGILRQGEDDWKASGLDADDDEAVLKAIAANPRLLERPIVLSGDRAVLGRPPENVDALLG